MTTWNVYIDWDRDFAFTEAADSIFEDVISIEWSIGFGKAYQNVSDETTCSIVVKNDTGKYSPENTESELYGKLLPQRMVKISATVGGTTYVMWRGWVDSIKPDWKTAGAASGKIASVIRCVGAKQFLQDADLSLQLMLNKRGDQIVDEVLQRIVLPPAKETGWLLGIPGFSELGEPPDGNTILGSKEDYSTVETGELTFATYGDTRESARPTNVDGWRIIKDVTEAERGRFFFDREGYAVWWNRSHFLDDWEDDGVVDSSGASGERPFDLSYDYGRSVMTRAQVIAHQRKEGSAVTLWTLDHTVTVQGGETVAFDAPYTDENAQQVGAESVTTTGATFSSGTAEIAVSGKADRAEIRLYNSGTTPAVLTALTVQGTLLTASNRIVATKQNLDATALYGRRKELKLNLAAIDNLEDALEIARFELDRRSEPRGEVEHFTVRRAADGVENLSQLLWTVGTRLRVKLPEIGHEDSYFVVGELHRVRKGGKVHETRYTLEPCVYTRLAEIASDEQDTSADLQNDATDKTALSQSFTTPAQAYRLKRVRVWLKKVGSPTGDLTVKLYSDDGNEPDSLVTDGTSDTVAASDLLAGYSWVDFDFADLPALSASTKYWAVLETTDGAAADNYVTWGAIQTDLLTNLVSYWELEEESGDRADTHGANTLSEYAPVTAVAGIQGNAAQFVAANSNYLYHVSNADLQTGNVKFAVAAWVTIDASTGANQGIVAKDVGQPQREWELYYQNASGKFGFAVSSDGSNALIVSRLWGTAATLGVRYFVIAYHDPDGDVIAISVNGGTPITLAHTLGVFAGTSQFAIGKFITTPLSGNVDEVAYWKGWIPDAAALAALYNGGAGVSYEDLDALELLTGLVDYWKLDETSGQRMDSHGTNHLTDPRTVSSVSGVKGDAARVSGSSTYLKHADNADFSQTGNFTWQVWVRFSALTQFLGLINRFLSAGQRSYHLQYVSSTNRLGLSISYDGTATAYQAADTFGALSANTWCHALIWRDADNDLIGISVNDEADTLAHSLGVHDTATDDIYFGNPSSGITVDMDEMALWNTVLSAAQRTWLYNAGAGRSYADLTGHTGEMKAQIAAAWVAEGADGCMEVLGVV